jgi:hypothetical protein
MNEQEWAAGYINEDETIHVWPLSEQGKHCLVGVTCFCNPTVEILFNGAVVVSHNRMEQ